MHWSGWVRLVAIADAIIGMIVAKEVLHWPLLGSLAVGPVIYIAVPVLIGLVSGIRERRQIKQSLVEKDEMP